MESNLSWETDSSSGIFRLCDTPRFSRVFITGHHVSLSWTRVLSSSYHPLFFEIQFLRLSSHLLRTFHSVRFLHQNFVCISPPKLCMHFSTKTLYAFLHKNLLCISPPKLCMHFSTEPCMHFFTKTLYAFLHHNLVCISPPKLCMHFSTKIFYAFLHQNFVCIFPLDFVCISPRKLCIHFSTTTLYAFLHQNFVCISPPKPCMRFST